MIIKKMPPKEKMKDMFETTDIKNVILKAKITGIKKPKDIVNFIGELAEKDIIDVYNFNGNLFIDKNQLYAAIEEKTRKDPKAFKLPDDLKDSEARYKFMTENYAFTSPFVRRGGKWVETQYYRAYVHIMNKNFDEEYEVIKAAKRLDDGSYIDNSKFGKIEDMSDEEIMKHFSGVIDNFVKIRVLLRGAHDTVRQGPSFNEFGKHIVNMAKENDIDISKDFDD